MLGDDPAPTTSSPGPGKCSPPSPTSSTFATKPWPPPVSVDWKYSPSFVVHVALASAVISRRGGAVGGLVSSGWGVGKWWWGYSRGAAYSAPSFATRAPHVASRGSRAAC